MAENESKSFYEFVIEQAIQDRFVTLITLDSDKPITRSEALENLSELIEKVHDAKSMFLVIEDQGIVFSKNDGPIRISINEKAYGG